MQGLSEATLSSTTESGASKEHFVPGVAIASASTSTTRGKVEANTVFIVAPVAVLTWMVYDMILTLGDEVRFP